MNPESEELLKVLKKHFPPIAEKNLQMEIAEVGRLRQFRAGEIIMDYGSYVRAIPLIVKGSIKVVREDESGNEVFLYFLRAGESCTMSFSCCMMHKKSIIRTVAEEDTTLIAIPIRYMDEWMSRYQSWKNFVMLSYENRMEGLLNTIDSIAFRKLDDRLLEYLQMKSQANHTQNITVTHQEIARDLNASREAISRLLKKLEQDEVIALGRNQIRLLEEPPR